MKTEGFKEKVFAEVSKIPEGSVATYGQIAQRAGYPGAARAVGNILHSNTDPVCVPCHRVVDAKGCPGKNYKFGGPQAQLEKLKAEGVSVIDGRIVMEKCRLI